MAYLLSQKEVLEYNKIKEDMNIAIEENRLLDWVITESYGADNILPEEIYTVRNQLESIKESNEDDGPTLISMILGLAKNKVDKTIKSPEKSSVILRALKEKLLEVKDKEERAKAADRGLFSTLIYTIKKAILWLISKFKDLKDDAYDTIYDKPVGYSKAKRDYKDVTAMGNGYITNKADWLDEPYQ